MMMSWFVWVRRMVMRWGVLVGVGFCLQSLGQGVNPGVPWTAVDALGRAIPTPAEAGALKPDRFVGMFYFLWHSAHQGKSPHWDGPYDIARILEADPEALNKPKSPLWGPIGMYHYWGEPLFGYYHSRDPWVLRRHAQLLADAGIDTLIFDTTNAETYADVYQALCSVFSEVRREGGRTPQIAFMVNTDAGKTAQRIYEDLYRPGRFRELWFQWQGKPLMICDPAQASAELKAFFTLRRAHWPFELVNTPYAWHWEATYPQPYGYTDDPSKPEQLTVSVAQNLRQSDGKVTNMSSGEARGRSFHQNRVESGPEAVNHGYNFEEQWQRAFELEPPFVMVTGWNEWIAGRWGKPDGPLVFVDQFNQEYSRDIEPAAVGHRDNYYWQLVSNVRRYKGAPPLPNSSPPKTIRIQRGFEQWDEVTPKFEDHIGETTPRDFNGVAGRHYTNRSGRNDIVFTQVTHDRSNVYFHVRTREPLSSPTDPGWMWLFLDADQDPSTGWEGFDFVVNRTLEKGKTTWLERHVNGWQWKAVKTVSMRVEGRDLHLAIPCRALGLSNRGSRISLDFQWADNLRRPGDIMDFYVSGDVAPEGRFRYRYEGL
ncbi:MAG TPA: hypothetical protein P5186_19790 [Candidatus Paceibacterota bacterium]|nr:hypothetical protein [Verrucomicrobiota bacterium]HRY50301.1 hypothetical protein [Candidatus Paceibacterota bacterium]